MNQPRNSRAIRSFIFDMGNVLLDFDFNPAFRRLSALTGTPVKKIQDYFVQSGLEVLFDGGKITSRQFYNQVRAALRLRISFDQFTRIWNNIFTPDVQMVQLARKLGKTHRLVLLSNTNSMHARYIEKRYAAILNIFDVRLYSFRKKMRKPDDRLYRTAVRACRARTHQIFYIDDRMDFTEAASDLGIRSFTYQKNFATLCRELKQLRVL